jgi:hypothetical protein
MQEKLNQKIQNTVVLGDVTMTNTSLKALGFLNDALGILKDLF